MPRDLTHTRDIKIDYMGCRADIRFLDAPDPTFRLCDLNKLFDAFCLFEVIQLRLSVTANVTAMIALCRQVPILNLQGES
jgi:hypothetical protein